MNSHKTIQKIKRLFIKNNQPEYTFAKIVNSSTIDYAWSSVIGAPGIHFTEIPESEREEL